MAASPGKLSVGATARPPVRSKVARLGALTGPWAFGYTYSVVRTYQQKTAEATHDWYIVDAAGERLGTLAVRVARALSGKRKPTWTPHIDGGDHVVVINAEKIELGGGKWDKKLYYRHSGYPGALKVQTAKQVAEKHPERLIERAVRGMLAPNRMRSVQLNRLKVCAGAEHPHAAQKPQPLT